MKKLDRYTLEYAAKVCADQCRMWIERRDKQPVGSQLHSEAMYRAAQAIQDSQQINDVIRQLEIK